MTNSIPAADISQVLAEIQEGGGLSLSAASRLVPGHRGKPSTDPSTIFRWITRGTQTTNGQIIKLEAVKAGARWITTRSAVTRFITSLTAAAVPDATPAQKPLPRSPTARNRASEIAAQKLKQMGA